MSRFEMDSSSPCDAIQVASTGALKLGEKVQATKTSGLVAFINRYIFSKFSLIPEVAIPHGDLARDIERVLGEDERDIIGDGGCWLWQLDFVFS